jgi:two-component system sensor histidine kinase/response regulator
MKREKTMENKPKILIIDDEEVVLDSCLLILEGSGYEIKTTSDAILGTKLVTEFQPDLVLVDLKMPGLSGLEVIDKVYEFDPTIVIIVITGYATINSAVESMKKGAYDFLPKPFTPDELRVITQRGLEKRELVLETIALRKEKEMLLEHFAARVSHELKSPLGAIQQNLYALTAELSGIISDEQKNRLEHLKSRIDDLLKLILTWLRVFTVDVNKIRETFKPVSIELVIAKAIDSIQPQAMRKDIEIVPSIIKPVSDIFGDEGTLVEVIVNLLSNAVKYSRVGSKITVVAEEKEDKIHVSVTDTGVGIAKEDLPYIFEMFYTGKSGQPAERGCGMGLAICRRIIEAHQGSITVESEPGTGSIFTIFLPPFSSNEPLENI